MVVKKCLKQIWMKTFHAKALSKRKGAGKNLAIQQFNNLAIQQFNHSTI